METHSGWRRLKRSQAAEPFSRHGKLYLQSVLGRLSVPEVLGEACALSEKRLETGSSCCCDHEAASDASGTRLLPRLVSMGVKEDRNEVLLCWVLCPLLLLETGEQSGFKM